MVADRPGAQRHIPACVYIIVAVPYGRNLEIPVTPRDERIFIYLASGSAACALVGLFGDFHIIDLHIRREGHIRSFEERDIAFTFYSHCQGCRLVGHKGILAQCGRDGEIPHPSSECGRRSCRKRRHIDCIWFCQNPFADSPLILEETVEYARTGRWRHPHIDDTHQFGRINGYLPRLLRDQHVFPQYSGIIDIAIHILPLELYVGRGFHLLTPETVECRETRILEPCNVHPLVQFQRSHDRLSDNYITSAESKPHKEVIIRDDTDRRP